LCKYKTYTYSLLAVSSFNETNMIVGNRQAWQLEYECKGIGGIIKQGMNSPIINDDIEYSIVFMVDKRSYDRYFPIAQKMVNSFKIRR
jgi:hypothetical protein